MIRHARKSVAEAAGGRLGSCVWIVGPRGSSFKMNGLKGPKVMRATSLMLFAAVALLGTVPVAAQVKTGLSTQVARPVPAAPKPVAAKPAKAVKPESAATGAPVPGNPDFKADQAQAAPLPPPPALPPAVWDLVSAQDLLYYIEQIGKEGLSP